MRVEPRPPSQSRRPSGVRHRKSSNRQTLVVDFEISFIDDEQIVVVKTSGRATLEGFDAYLDAMTSDPRWRTGMSILSDHSELDTSDLSQHDIENLVSHRLSETAVVGGGLCAIVAGTPLSFGLGRMFEAYAEDVLPLRIRVFATTDEALAWLREERAAR